MSEKWDKQAKEIAKRIEVDGIETFLEWSVIHATMFVGGAEYVRRERAEVLHLLPEDADTNMAHQAFHLYQWMQATGLTVADISSVAEIGGGYGSMFVLWRRLGFTGPYYTIDYQPMHQLQRYYAEKMNARPIPKKITRPVKVDLLIACHSLGEMDMDEREAVLSEISFDHFLVTHAGRWDDVDNVMYFSTWGGYTFPGKYADNIRYTVG